MIKIAVTGTRGFPGIQGGIENHCEQLYANLVKHDCTITVFTRKPYMSSHIREHRGIKLIQLSCPKNKFLEAIVHTLKSVFKARTLQPDVLHIHAIGPSLFAPLARALGMKVVVTSHGPDYLRKKWPVPAKIFLKFCERMGMKYAHQVIAIADNIATDIAQKYDRKATVLPNGVVIPSLEKTHDSLRKYNLKEKRYIMSVGRFVPEKGFDDLMDAFDQSNFDQWKLVIVGDADHKDTYSRTLKIKAGQHDNIVLTGFLTGKPLKELYSHAGLFVLSSYYEGLPIVLLEAMSYGLSCIASDIPANRNVKMDEGRFFKTGDIQSLAAKIKEFSNKPWGEAERKKQIDMVADTYNWEKIAGETMKVYKNVL